MLFQKHCTNRHKQNPLVDLVKKLPVEKNKIDLKNKIKYKIPWKHSKNMLWLIPLKMVN